MFVLKNTKISILMMKLGKVTLLYIVSYIDRFEFSTHLDNLADNTLRPRFSFSKDSQSHYPTVASSFFISIFF